MLFLNELFTWNYDAIQFYHVSNISSIQDLRKSQGISGVYISTCIIQILESLYLIL